MPQLHTVDQPMARQLTVKEPQNYKAQSTAKTQSTNTKPQQTMGATKTMNTTSI